MLNTRRKPWPFFMYTSLIDAVQGQYKQIPAPKSLGLPLTELFCACGVKTVVVWTGGQTRAIQSSSDSICPISGHPRPLTFPAPLDVPGFFPS